MDGNVLHAPSVFFRPAEAADLQTIIDLETASYPADEAATPERLAFRLEHAGEYFLVAVAPPATAAPSGAGDGALQVVGFVCSTLTAANSLTHESMAAHEPQGGLLCVHSASPGVKEMRMLCKEHLVKFYEGAGFMALGPSPVVHGQDQWIEMAMQLGGEGAE